VGDPIDPATEQATANDKRSSTDHAYIDAGNKEGAKLLTGGKRLGSRGYYMSRAVVDVERRDAIAPRRNLRPVHVGC